MLIKHTDELLKFLENLGQPPYLTLDTEFISEKTYYPQLCLIQIGYGDQAAVIDPLSGLDLQPLIKFLENPSIIKVLHAAFQDLTIFWNEFNLALTPIFDTQIAAMACGFGDQVSYGHLVKALTNTTIDKSSQIVDWSRRPLLDKHIEYAIGDVSHLGRVYEKLSDQLDSQNRRNWIIDEMKELSNSKRYVFNIETQVKKLKMRHASRHRLATAHELVQWRENQAKTKNIPRNWVIKDLALRDIVSNTPSNMEELGRIRGIGGVAKGQAGGEILDCILRAKRKPIDECPPAESTQYIEQANEDTMVLLRALLRHVCELKKVAPKLVASKADLEHIGLGESSNADQGWRWDIFGSLAHQLTQGKIGLTLNDNKVKIISL